MRYFIVLVLAVILGSCGHVPKDCDFSGFGIGGFGGFGDIESIEPVYKAHYERGVYGSL